MPSMKEDSLKNWVSSASTEHIQLGCLQRIADAVEKISGNYVRLTEDRDRYKSWYENERKRSQHLFKKIAGLKGAVTRSRRKRG